MKPTQSDKRTNKTENEKTTRKTKQHFRDAYRHVTGTVNRTKTTKTTTTKITLPPTFH